MRRDGETLFYDESRGSAGSRTVYGELAAAPPTEIGRRVARAERLFRQDAPVLPVPRLLSATDFGALQRGVRQRARALDLFLRDHYFGERRYARARLIPGAILRRIVARHFEQDAGSVLRPDNFRFFYAPDLVRDAAGCFRVIEDNVGFVGGLGDLEAMHGAALALGVPAGRIRPAPEFYAILAADCRSRARRYGTTHVVRVAYEGGLRETHEDERLAGILARYGIPTVRRADLRADAEGVFCRGRRVGYVWLDVEAADVEPRHPATFHRYLANGIDEAPAAGRESLLRLLDEDRAAALESRLGRLAGVNVAVPERAIGILNFWAAVRAGRVGTNCVPGVEFVADKEFYRYVGALIRFYLQEEPLLRDLDTRSLADGRHRARVFASPEKWVVKGVNGKGGEKVWLGRTLTERQRARLATRVAAAPDDYIAQTYVEFSRLAGHSVDARVYAFVDGPRLRVSDGGWGRAVRVGHHGKVNIAAGGALTALAVLLR